MRNCRQKVRVLVEGKVAVPVSRLQPTHDFFRRAWKRCAEEVAGAQDPKLDANRKGEFPNSTQAQQEDPSKTLAAVAQIDDPASWRHRDSAPVGVIDRASARPCGTNLQPHRDACEKILSLIEARKIGVVRRSRRKIGHRGIKRPVEKTHAHEYLPERTN